MKKRNSIFVKTGLFEKIREELEIPLGSTLEEAMTTATIRIMVTKPNTEAAKRIRQKLRDTFEFHIDFIKTKKGHLKNEDKIREQINLFLGEKHNWLKTKLNKLKRFMKK